MLAERLVRHDCYLRNLAFLDKVWAHLLEPSLSSLLWVFRWNQRPCIAHCECLVFVAHLELASHRCSLHSLANSTLFSRENESSGVSEQYDSTLRKTCWVTSRLDGCWTYCWEDNAGRIRDGWTSNTVINTFCKVCTNACSALLAKTGSPGAHSRRGNACAPERTHTYREVPACDSVDLGLLHGDTWSRELDRLRSIWGCCCPFTRSLAWHLEYSY